jgi:phenylalanyl-tRNA synthetase beta chain
MKLPLSWLKDYVDIDLPLEDLARLLTGAGLEVDEVKVVGLPMPAGDKHEFKFTGISWDPEKIVVAQINEVLPHPNADRLVLCKLDDGNGERIVLTGAPNLFEYKGIGPLPKPLKAAYARLGTTLYDGHQPGYVLTTLKKTKIRGVESDSMVCSEKELGISDEHEGIIILDDDAPTGVPLADYMGDAVFEISILPNMIRDACVIGVAREVAALTGKALKRPKLDLPQDGPSIKGKVNIQINDPNLNPRFVLGLVEGVEARPSPYWVQRRLRLAGVRAINSVVDATNYVMLELGEPLHAFDYDTLLKRAGGKAPTIITRAAHSGETLRTLDGADHTLEDYTILVTDTAGPLSLAGIMGGEESEVEPHTRNVLLEGASWNFINVRRTTTAHHIASEAGYRFARGIHPAVAPDGVRLCLLRMAAWSGGTISRDLVDAYPAPVKDPVVVITTGYARDHLGIDLSAAQIADLLQRIEFQCSVQGDAVTVQTPPHRLDIGEGVIGEADVLEEIARLYGYDNIPATRLADELPRQRPNPAVEREERLRDILTGLGIQEVINYRLTHPEREARLYPTGEAPADLIYTTLQNPIAVDRAVMRRSLLPGVMENLERSIRLRPRLAFYEIGPVFLQQAGELLPAEPRHLAIALSGLRRSPTWDTRDSQTLDFYDLKGVMEGILGELHISGAVFAPDRHPSYHPGRCAKLILGETVIGHLGELHPLVKEHYDLGAAPVLAAELDLDALLGAVPARYEVSGVPVFPPVLEDIAVVVDESTPADQVVAAIREGGGKLLTGVQLFDIYRGAQLGAGKKSLAYSLTYQAPDRTLTDEEATKVRQRIIRRLEEALGAKLRS